VAPEADSKRYGKEADYLLLDPGTKNICLTVSFKGAAFMNYQQIKYEVEDRILTITLNRPERLNAYTEILRAEMIDALDHADADDNIRAIIVKNQFRGE